MIDRSNARNALHTMLTEPIFISEHEIETITGYDWEDFEAVVDKIDKGFELGRNDYFLIRQALHVLLGFRISPDILTERFGEHPGDAIEKMMNAIDAQLA